MAGTMTPVSVDLGPMLGGALPSAAVTRVVDEADAYSGAVRGVEIEVARLGRGVGPSVVDAVEGDGLATTSVHSLFPMLARASISDDVIAVTVFRSTPPGTRWCGSIEPEPGTVLAYGPGVEHTAVNPTGIGFAFTVIERSSLEALAEDLSGGLRFPARGEALLLPATPESAEVSRAMSSVVESALAGVPADANREDDVPQAIARALHGEHRHLRTPAGRRIDDGSIVHACMEYAEACERMPTMRELCLAAAVSESRLRLAFVREFDVPPTRFFRVWALSKAREQLQVADPGSATVSRVALGLGFGHLGRFSARYKTLHGQLPSATLRSRPAPSGMHTGVSWH